LSRSDCNSVAPGVILAGAALANSTEEYRNEILASVRSNRPGVPEDLAAMVAFLFSDDGAYATGQTFLVDGSANVT
jgi:NAD(P)-dependent dehydrogenase (short-subunit alcohol dehydrogenase family)